MNTSTVDRVEGTRDLPPQTWAAQRAVCSLMLDAIAGFGYQGVGVPLIEAVDLYERRAGARVVSQLLEFPNRGGQILCLRPELTASVARAWAADRRRQCPARLMYSGSAFRRGEGGGGDIEQFTEVGAELIGIGGPAGDAEVIALAYAALSQAQLWERRIVLGHLGLLSDVLAQLGLSPRARSILLEGLADLRAPGGGIESVREDALRKYRAAAPQDLGWGPGLDRDRLDALVASIAGGGEDPIGARSRDQIVDRLAAKFERGDETERLNQAFDLLSELATCSGPADSALASTGMVLAQRGIDAGPLAEIDRLVKLLRASGEDIDGLEFDPALGRGLQYYTGLVFDVYCRSADQWLAVGGGGRYDDLLSAISPQAPTPAVGLSFRIENLLEAGGERLTGSGQRSPADVLVLADGDVGAALALARSLRRAWLRTRLGDSDQPVEPQIDRARREGLPAAVQVGPRDGDEVVLHDIAGGAQRRVPPADVAALVRELMAEDK
ncbi:MAG: hypothetical protein F4Z40_02205 [Chloroflexi bacterium]|nr:hypothetical protein [Chloroflexota bacterium]